MSYTNETEKLHLPQWVGTDRPTYLIDFNQAFLNIDNAFIANDTDIETIRAKLNSFISTMLNNTKDLNDIENGNFSLEENIDFAKQNRPDKRKSYLKSYSDNVGTWQILVTNENKLYIRSKMNGESWSAWTRLISETELKLVIDDINNKTESINEKINEINTKLNNFDEYKKDNIFLGVRFIIDPATWLDDLTNAWKIKPHSNTTLTLKPANIDSIQLSNYRCVGVSEAICVYQTELLLHAFNVRYKGSGETGENEYYITVYNQSDKIIDITDKKNNTMVEGIYIKQEFFNKPSDIIQE